MRWGEGVRLGRVKDGGGGGAEQDQQGGVPKRMLNGDNGCFAVSSFLLLIGIEVGTFIE